MNKRKLLLATVTLIAALALVACESPVGSDGSGGSSNDSGDGTSAAQQYGINLVNAGTATEDFTVSYAYSFCRAGESANDCLSRGAGFGLVTAQPGESAVGGNDTPLADDEVRYYLEWDVTSGEGTIEFAAVTETDFGTSVDQVIDSFDVTNGQSGSDFFLLE